MLVRSRLTSSDFSGSASQEVQYRSIVDSKLSIYTVFPALMRNGFGWPPFALLPELASKLRNSRSARSLVPLGVVSTFAISESE